MIPIQEIAGVLNPAPKGRHHLAIFRFFCDESYDSDPRHGTGLSFYVSGKTKPVHIPKTYVVGGFFAGDEAWGNLEPRWRTENLRVGVTKFEAAHVNARTGEFEGWDKDKQIDYSKNLLSIIQEQKRFLTAVSCAIWVSDYYRIVNEYGRKKLGSAYIACFKSCIALIAREMDLRGFPSEDKFAVVLDRNPEEQEAIELFYKMKDGHEWAHYHRLASCTPGSRDVYIPLQAADLIAYETFRLIHNGATGERVRKGLRSLFPYNGFMGHPIDSDALRDLKAPLENATCADGGFIVCFPPVDLPLERQPLDPE